MSWQVIIHQLLLHGKHRHLSVNIPFLLLILFPVALWAQPHAPATSEPGLTEDPRLVEIRRLADTLSAVNAIHAEYVGFDGIQSAQYQNFETLTALACPTELLGLMQHDNAVVRGYAFWGLARQQFPKLDSVLLAHARDESLVREMQGGMISSVPLIDFMQWVVDPALMDEESRKLEQDVFERVSELRFSDR